MSNDAADGAAERQVADLLAAAKDVFVLTGAGISTASGIPDFRGPNGLFTRYPEASRMFDYDAYISDPELRQAAWKVRSNSEMWDAQPNRGHHAVAAWTTGQRRVRVATQNIDGLHVRAGSDEVLELHGTFWETECLGCRDRLPIDVSLARVAEGDPDPKCETCGALLKTATISFGQMLDPDVITGAANAATESDLAFAIGSSLTVQPAASLVAVAAETGAPLVIVNAEPTPYDDIAAVVIRSDIEHALARVTELLGMDLADS